LGFAGRSNPGPRPLGPAICGALALAIVGLASPVAEAVEPQYRKVVLVDGRVLQAEVLSTEPQGLLMEVPQGTTLISFELLLDMTPITEQDYLQQPRWVVYYDVPQSIEKDVLEMLAAMGSIEPQRVGTAGNDVSPQLSAKAHSECNRNVKCIAHTVGGIDQWLWVLTIEPVASGEVMLQSKVNKSGAEDPYEQVFDGRDRDDLWRHLHEALGLRPSGSPPRPDAVVEAPRRPYDEKRVVALSFVPLPGVPSLAQRDAAGFALAMSVVVPSTALWVGAVGSNGQSMLETGALTVGGYYAVTVLANQVAGMRSMNKAKRVGVTAVPTEGGGAQIMLVGADR
jgi:hypothetical protein